MLIGADHDRNPMSNPLNSVQVIEVSARDGLQSDPTLLSTSDKAAMIRRFVDVGVRRAEVVSFVNPQRVPQMADAADLMAILNEPGFLEHRSTCSLAGLVLNAHGLDRAIAAGVDQINVVVVCSDTFATRNQGRDTAGLIAQWHEIAQGARSAGLFATLTLAAAFGCPYEGEVSADRLRWVLDQVMQQPPDELALADSIGAAVPTDVRQRLALARDVAPITPLRCHFHNTRNTGMANVAAAVEWGVGAIDASIGGIGGCPFAPNATGNVPTEDVVYLLHRMGFETGIDLAAACAMVPWLEILLQHPVPGLLARAGLFPARG